jgi:hypothetical protein
MKHLIKNAESTNDMYGYSAVAIPLTADNVTEIIRIRKLIESVKKLSPDITGIKMALISNLVVHIFNDEFEPNLNELESIELSSEDVEKYRNLEDNEYKVENPSLTITDRYFKVTWNSKYTEDWVGAYFYFEEIEILCKNNLANLT